MADTWWSSAVGAGGALAILVAAFSGWAFGRLRERGTSRSFVDRPQVEEIVSAIREFRRDRRNDSFWHDIPELMPTAFEEARTAIDLLHDRRLGRRWSALLHEIENYLGQASSSPELFRSLAQINSTRFAIENAQERPGFWGRIITAFLISGPQKTTEQLSGAEAKVLNRLGDLTRRLKIIEPIPSSARVP